MLNVKKIRLCLFLGTGSWRMGDEYGLLLDDSFWPQKALGDRPQLPWQIVLQCKRQCCICRPRQTYLVNWSLLDRVRLRYRIWRYVNHNTLTPSSHTCNYLSTLNTSFKLNAISTQSLQHNTNFLNSKLVGSLRWWTE